QKVAEKYQVLLQIGVRLGERDEVLAAGEHPLVQQRCRVDFTGTILVDRMELRVSEPQENRRIRMRLSAIDACVGIRNSSAVNPETRNRGVVALSVDDCRVFKLGLATACQDHDQSDRKHQAQRYAGEAKDANGLRGWVRHVRPPSTKCLLSWPGGR